MMKNSLKISFLMTVLTLVSCQKVINIDLKDSEPVIVIEGEVNEGDSLHSIIISKIFRYNI
jgi:hypothetical protein